MMARDARRLIVDRPEPITPGAFRFFGEPFSREEFSSPHKNVTGRLIVRGPGETDAENPRSEGGTQPQKRDA